MEDQDETFQNQTEINETRYFKIVDPDIGECTGRYHGLTPKQAATKAFVAMTKQNKCLPPVPSVIAEEVIIEDKDIKRLNK